MGLSCGKSALHVADVAVSRSHFRSDTQKPSPASSQHDARNGEQSFEIGSVRDQGIVVLVRIRPKSEKEGAQRTFMKVQGSTQLYVPASKTTPTEKRMSFDAVLPERTSQEQVYQVAGPKLIHNVLQGFNATMIAYGQTGSGKTFTMEGTSQDPGVTPRLCRGIFQAIQASSSMRRVRVLATYVEIYQESIRDLLADTAALSSSPGARRRGSNIVSPSKGVGMVGESGGNSLFNEAGPSPGGGKRGPTIRENKEGVYVEGITAVPVENEAAVLSLLAGGSSARTKGETQMNATSSRSHAVLTLSILQTPCDEDHRGPEGDNVSQGSHDNSSSGIGTIRSKISLVDLAGSERAKSTGAAGQRLKEGANINKSLSALGNVIKALTTASGAHVPYRDSKLTRLLQDSLGGTAYTVVCCNVSPIEASEQETLSTLRFAERLKKVRNKMVVHMDAKSKELLMLKQENAELRARIRHLEEIAGVSTKIPPASMVGGRGGTGDGSRGSGGTTHSRGGTPRSQGTAKGQGGTTRGTTRSSSQFGDSDMLRIRTTSTTSSFGSPLP